MLEHLFKGKATIVSDILSRAHGHKVEIDIRALTGPENAEYLDIMSTKMNIKSNSIDLGTKRAIKARNFLVKKGVMDWRGLVDEEGNNIPCNEENINALFKAHIPRDVISEIADAIRNLTNTGDTEEIDDENAEDYETVGGHESSET